MIAAFYSTFVLSAIVLLHKRLTTSSDDPIHYGPFRLGRFGVPTIILAILYSVMGIFFSFWPPSPSPSAVTMNWSIAVYGGAIVFSLGFWIVHGCRVYTGPLIEN